MTIITEPVIFFATFSRWFIYPYSVMLLLTAFRISPWPEQFLLQPLLQLFLQLLWDQKSCFQIAALVFLSFWSIRRIFSVYCAKTYFYLLFLNILVAEPPNHLIYSYGDYLCVTRKDFVLCGRKNLLPRKESRKYLQYRSVPIAIMSPGGCGSRWTDWWH